MVLRRRLRWLLRATISPLLSGTPGGHICALIHLIKLVGLDHYAPAVTQGRWRINFNSEEER
jgi:hypothetical protein